MWINWADIVEKTETGTPLVAYTIKLLSHELDQYLQQERTGIHMALKKGLPWKAILAELNMSAEQVDHKKVLSFLEKDLDSTLENWAAKVGPVETISPEFMRHAKSRLHKLLKAQGNEANIYVLGTMYAFEHEDKQDRATIEEAAHQIRLYCKTDPAFSVGVGGIASVRRIKDENGKATGMQPHPARGEGGTAKGKNKPVERYTGKVQALGMSKAQFLAAKSKGAQTLDDLKSWLEEQGIR